MKKFVALIFMICLCATLAFSFSSCGDKKEDEGIATEEGTKELSCVCGYVVEENIPMLEGAPSPKPTPDSSLPKQKSISAWIWIPISLSALIVLGLAFVLIRHKNKKRKD